MVRMWSGRLDEGEVAKKGKQRGSE